MDALLAHTRALVARMGAVDGAVTTHLPAHATPPVSVPPSGLSHLEKAMLVGVPE